MSMMPFAQRGYLRSTRLDSNTNNFQVISSPKDDVIPQIKLFNTAPIALNWSATLSEIERKICSESCVAKTEFFAPDGTRYSKASKLVDIMRFPYFKLRLDDANEYHIHSSTAPRESTAVKTPAEREFYLNSVNSYGMNINKADTSSKLFNFMVERLEACDANKTHTHEDVSMMIRDGLANYCLKVNSNREQLIEQLHLVDEALKPINAKIENAKEHAHIKSMMSGFTFVSVIAFQFALS